MDELHEKCCNCTPSSQSDCKSCTVPDLEEKNLLEIVSRQLRERQVSDADFEKIYAEAEARHKG